MKPNAAQGFTMLEVLVAILVLSLGLLGLAGLQTVSLRNNTGSAQRTIATQLAYDMADRMRANSWSVLTGDYNYTAYSSTGVAGQANASCLTTTGCSPQQIAFQDIYEWNQQICGALPQSSACSTTPTAPWGVVCIDSTPNDGTPAAPLCDNAAGAPYVIKIWWIEDRNNPSPTVPVKQWVTSFLP